MSRPSMSLFFEGAASREVTASAWLATLLSDPAFRIAFLKHITEPDVAGASDEWKVTVETNRHDIQLECAAQRIIYIIENKISSASFTVGQLQRYAEEQAVRTRDHRISIILVAPTKSSGRRELKRLTDAFPSEQVKGWHVGWEQIAGLVNTHQWPPDFDWFVKTGIDSIKQAIKNAKQEKWPLKDGREILESIVSLARDELQKDGSRWRTWRRSKCHRVHNTHSPITVCADVRFHSDNATNLQIPDKDDQGIRVKATIKIHLSSTGRRDKPRLAKWLDALKYSHTVPELGDVTPLQSSNWMHCEIPISSAMNDERQIASHVARMAKLALDWASELGE